MELFMLEPSHKLDTGCPSLVVITITSSSFVILNMCGSVQ